MMSEIVTDVVNRLDGNIDADVIAGILDPNFIDEVPMVAVYIPTIRASVAGGSKGKVSSLFDTNITIAFDIWTATQDRTQGLFLGERIRELLFEDLEWVKQYNEVSDYQEDQRLYRDAERELIANTLTINIRVMEQYQPV